MNRRNVLWSTADMPSQENSKLYTELTSPKLGTVNISINEMSHFVLQAWFDGALPRESFFIPVSINRWRRLHNQTTGQDG